MTVYTFESIAVYAELGGALRLARGARAFTTDPTTGAPVDATQGARVAPYVDADAAGDVTFTAESWPVRLTNGATYEDVWPVDAAGPAGTLTDAFVAAKVADTTPSLTRAALDADFVPQVGGLMMDALLGAGAAVGDAVTDDTAALNALLASAATFGANLLIGKHALTDSLNVPANVGMVGRDYESRLHLPAGAAFPAVLVDGVPNARLRSFRVTRAGATADGACAVAVRGTVVGAVIEDVTAESLADGFRIEGGMGTVPGTVSQLILNRCHATASDVYGFRIDDVDVVELTHCSSVVSGLDGVKLRKHTENVTLTGGYYTGATGGDGLDGYAGGATLTIQGGIYSGNGINGITLKTDALTLSDPAGYGYVRNITISGVHCDNNAGNGLALGRDGNDDDVTLPLMTDVTIQGGTYNNNTNRGIYVIAHSVSIVAPICTGNGLEGIFVNTNSLDVSIVTPQVAGNSVTTTNAADGIRIAGTRCQVIGGSSIGTHPDGARSEADLAAGTKTQRNGLRIDATAASTVVSGITLRHNASAAFIDLGTGTVLMPGMSDDAAWPMISMPNNKRIYTRTAAGAASSAMYMTASGNLNIGDSTNAGAIALLALVNVTCFPKFIAQGEVNILGALNHDGTTVGFYGTAPISKRATTADATDLATALTLVNALKADLIAYGLKS